MLPAIAETVEIVETAAESALPHVAVTVPHLLAAEIIRLARMIVTTVVGTETEMVTSAADLVVLSTVSASAIEILETIAILLPTETTVKV